MLANLIQFTSLTCSSASFAGGDALRSVPTPCSESLILGDDKVAVREVVRESLDL
jgi:hypothetical protein